VIASKNWTLNGGAEKIRRRLNRSVDDFDSMEIRLGKSAKFDGAGIYTIRLTFASINLNSGLTDFDA